MLAASDPRDWAWAGRPGAGRSTIDEWSALISSEIAEMRVSSDEGARFSAGWTRYGLGPIELNFLHCSAQTVTRSSEMIARSRSPNFELLFLRSGPMGFCHGEERGLAAPGCFVLLDDQRAYDLGFPKGSDCPTVRMPEQWLLDWVPDARTITGRPLGLRSPWARPLIGLLTAIADGGLPPSSLSRAALADQLGSMIAMLAGSAQAGAASAGTSGLARRAQDMICAGLGDPSLDPVKVAAELGVSVRHLHRVLARSGDSFGRRLNAARIAAAESLLLSREGRAMPIGEIAWRVGFADQSHFARLFRTVHGCSPSRFRDAAESS